VVNAWIGPRAGRAVLTTRARIADTGTVLAIAQMSDGSFWSDRAEVVVTLSACLEDGLI
jgi:sulfur-oxidizing protein SoxY